MGETVLPAESSAERERRVPREAAELAEALRQAAAGRVLSGPELEAWLDELGGDEEPAVRRLGSKPE
jgi:predicted transcriptional regulator